MDSLPNARAGLPVMLIGSYGIGKSDLLSLAAKMLGIQLLMRDLSLMEAVDLTGIPRINGQGRTQYAAPAFLPRKGRGLLLLEELNRTPPHVRAPCLQLLTARRLNDYTLPDGWLPVAAMNPPDGEFQVDPLDPALASRFLQIHVRADVTEWVAWARRQRLHAKVVEFVEMTPGVFDDPEANPRAWTWVSQLLVAWEQSETPWQCELLTAVAGKVGPSWAQAFLQFYEGQERPLTGEEIATRYGSLRAIVRRWRAGGRLDLLDASVEGFQRYLNARIQQEDPDVLLQSSNLRRHARQLHDDILPDMALAFRQWLDRHAPSGFLSEE